MSSNPQWHRLIGVQVVLHPVVTGAESEDYYLLTSENIFPQL
jgi:hypothetical protein